MKSEIQKYKNLSNADSEEQERLGAGGGGCLKMIICCFKSKIIIIINIQDSLIKRGNENQMEGN